MFQSGGAGGGMAAISFLSAHQIRTFQACSLSRQTDQVVSQDAFRRCDPGGEGNIDTGQLRQVVPALQCGPRHSV